MRIGPAGKKLIEDFEGRVRKVYPDPATGGAPFTVGIGHTGPDVRPGDVWTDAQIDAAFERDIAKFEKAVTEALDGYPASSNEFSAMVSLCFNIGPGNFRKSSVLRNHKKGDKVAAANSFKLWNKAAGKVLNGLVRRRAAESALYMKPPIVGKAVETRTEPDAPKPPAASPTIIGTATVAVAGVGQQLADNMGAIQSAHATVAQAGGFEWVTRALGALIVAAALFVLIRHWLKKRRGEG